MSSFLEYQIFQQNYRSTRNIGCGCKVKKKTVLYDYLPIRCVPF